MIREDRMVEVESWEGDTLVDILRRAGIPVDGVVVFSGERPVPIDDPVMEHDDLKVVTVSSGG